MTAWWLAILALSCLWPGALQAASLDSGTVADPLDKFVCAIPDQELDNAYQKALGGLSAEGQREMREGQRSWLHFSQVVLMTAMARHFCPFAGRGTLRLIDKGR